MSMRDEWPKGKGRRQKRDDEEREENCGNNGAKEQFNTVKETIIIKPIILYRIIEQTQLISQLPNLYSHDSLQIECFRTFGCSGRVRGFSSLVKLLESYAMTSFNVNKIHLTFESNLSSEPYQRTVKRQRYGST